MTKSTQPAKKKPTTSSDDSFEPSITTIKKSTCKSLQGKTTLTYQIGIDDASALHWKLAASTGSGIFDSTWKAFKDIQQALSGWEKDFPITGLALKPLFTGSVNSKSYLLACLIKEGVLEPVPDSKRHYQLADTKPFLAEMEKLKAAHSKTSKAKPRARGKATTRIPKGKAKPSTGK